MFCAPAACRATAPEGVFECERDAECPPGMRCDSGLCYSRVSKESADPAPGTGMRATAQTAGGAGASQPVGGLSGSTDAAISGGSGGAQAGAAASGEVATKRLANGEACAASDGCASGHCDGVCCATGDCCRSVNDCKRPEGPRGVCSDPKNCRGTGAGVACTEFTCVATERDDSACTGRVMAGDCGPYRSVFCSGAPLQEGAPACPTSCTDDSQCDAVAHCADARCVPDLAKGSACTRGADCADGFCKNMRNGKGVCCDGLTDCCTYPEDCPPQYQKPPTCNDVSTCSGSEVRVQCIAYTCLATVVGGLGACAGMVASGCGAFADYRCGVGNRCKSTCQAQADCDANAICQDGQCVAN